MYAKLPFNVDRDFEPLTQVVSLPFLVYLHPSLPLKTMPDLIAYAKANPGALTWSSSGDGGLPHLSGELIRLASGIDTRRIPYKGSAPAFNDLLGGRVHYCIDAVSIGLQHVKAGRLVALAATGPRRLEILPAVPTLSETLPGVEVVNWYGALLPRGTPKRDRRPPPCRDGQGDEQPGRPREARRQRLRPERHALPSSSAPSERPRRRGGGA